MNLKTILSVIPSITEIVGELFQAKNNDYLSYAFKYPGMDGTPSIHFIKKGNDIVAANLLPVPVRITFPRGNQQAGKFYLIEPYHNKTITEDIAGSAGAYNNHFEVSAVYDTPAENNPEITLSGKGRVKKEIKGRVALNESIYVETIDENLLIYTSEDYTLDGIISLSLSGERNEPGKRFQNISLSETQEKDPYCLESAIEEFQESEWIDIEIDAVCKVKNNPAAIKNPVFTGELMQERDYDFLKKGRCLNR